MFRIAGFVCFIIGCSTVFSNGDSSNTLAKDTKLAPRILRNDYKDLPCEKKEKLGRGDCTTKPTGMLVSFI